MRKWWWIAVVLVLAGGAFVTYRTLLRPSEAGVSNAALETAVVERGTLRVTVEGSGNLALRDELGLSFDAAGKVVAVLVETGDRVTVGMPLARLDDVDARRSVTEAELQVRQAEVSLQSAQMKLDELLNWEPDQDAVEQAQANLAAAEADYHKALASSAHVDDQLASAEVKLAQAQRALEDAQEAYNTAFDPARDWELQDKRLGPRLEAERETAEDRLVTAQENLRLAEASYNLEVATLSDNTKSAWSKVISARIALEKEQTGPDEDEVESARLQVEQAEISLEQARLKLEAAQRALADTELVAPVDGTVTAVNIEVGQAVGTSQVAVSIADLASLVVEIGLDETDIVEVEVGQPAVVMVDAFDDAEFSGRVIHVSPTASVQSGVVLYEVTIALDATEVPVRAGMTTDAEVVIDSAEDVLVIPLKAVRSIGGRHFVLRQLREGEEPQTRLFRQGSGGQQGGGMVPARMSDGGEFQALSPEERAQLRAQMQAQLQQVEGFVVTPIELGVTTDAYAEVVQGLEEGDVVLISVLTDDVGAQAQPAPRGLGIPGIGSGALGGRK